MILAADVGNTNISLGGFENGNLVFTARISTNLLKTSDEYASSIIGILALYGVSADSVDGAVISSVVPSLNTVIKTAFKFAFSVEPLIVGPGIKTGIKIHCDNPVSVGSDIICACVAAHSETGKTALVIDMGTATKMMVVDKNGTFIGVSIIPGVLMGLKALSSGTAQLPQVSLEVPASVIGKNTADSMKSGVIFGNASMIDGMIDRFCDELGEKENLRIIATGGLAETVVRQCRHKIEIDENLVLKGLYILYSKNK